MEKSVAPRSNETQTQQRSRYLKVGSSVLVAMLAAGCGNSSTRAADADPVVAATVASNTAHASTPKPETTQSSTAVRKSKHHIIFDYLNHGSKTIDVYASPTSHKETGTFEDGQSAPVYCQEEGRSVSSQPGEHPADTSSVWFKVETNSTNNETIYWATEVYTQNGAQLESQLPNC